MRVEFSVNENDDPDENFTWNTHRGTRQNWKVPMRFKVIWISGAINPQDDQYHKLLYLFLHDTRRWDIIYFTGQGQPSSPEFLALLQTTFSKTEKLHLADCMVDDASYSCLNSGILEASGIRKVEIWTNRVRPIIGSQMLLLSHGLSLTTTLETLMLPGDLTTPGVVDYLITGLEANNSLTYLKSCWCRYPPGTLPLVISALSSHQKLRRLMLRTDEIRHPEVQEALQTLLSRDDCKLEDVDLMRPHEGSSSRNETTSSFNLGKFDNPNTPLKSLHLSRLGINGSDLGPMLPSCKNLVELDLTGNNFSDLEPLDCLLLGDSCSLERLTLYENPISIENARIFAQKLPRMKILRRLELRSTPFIKDKKFLDEFIDYANQNTSMEQIFTTYSEMDALIPKLMYGPCLNRAGRRYLGHNPGSLPLNLLPIAFVRAREIPYFNPIGSWREPMVRLDGLDASFWLLRENDNLLSHLL